MAVVELETGGLVCPFPLIDAKNKMKELSIGDELLIKFDCTQATESIPNWAAENSYPVTRFEQVGQASCPLMSAYTLTDPDAQFGDRNREEADVIPVIQSHVDGYNDKDAWKDYDAIGVKGGNAVLKMDDDTTLRFNAPKTENPTGSAWVAFNNKGNWTGISILY